ncbi:hypothetical protein IJG72_07300 [bacterium]|nr:hypothetical protein [bacterium]
MMVFFIIGIVAVASIGLSKPKDEYMRKIAIYSAFENLQNAVSEIAAEGHIDLATEVGSCPKKRNETTHVCSDEEYAKYPGRSNELTKDVARDATLYANDTYYINTTAYSSLTTEAAKRTFIHLQNGLCQRLATAFKIDSFGNNCPTSLTDTSYGSLYSTISTNDYELITSNLQLYANFNSLEPSLYLPNGNVYYFGKYVCKDVKNMNLTNTRIGCNSYRYNFYYNVAKNYNNESNIITGSSSSTDYLFNNQLSSSSYVYYIPNELSLLNVTRVARLKSDQKYQYAKYLFSHSKDYFNVYIDINGKRQDTNDKVSGPDTLNKDIFLFRVYRDGTVVPDYFSNFPKEYLKARVLYKAPGTTTYKDNWSGKYASVPYVYAGCYANTIGAYGLFATGTYVDYSNLCPLPAYSPLPECYNANGTSNCKVILNKPSFFVK